MPLKGQAKVEYQRNLMRMRRAGVKGGSNTTIVQPSCPPGLCPINEVRHCPCVELPSSVSYIDADGYPVYE